MTTIQITDLNPIISKLTNEEQTKVQGGFRHVLSAFRAGYRIGQWLNENTPIQKWISDAFDS